MLYCDKDNFSIPLNARRLFCVLVIFDLLRVVLGTVGGGMLLSLLSTRHRFLMLYVWQSLPSVKGTQRYDKKTFSVNLWYSRKIHRTNHDMMWCLFFVIWVECYGKVEKMTNPAWSLWKSLPSEMFVLMTSSHLYSTWRKIGDS